MVRLLPAHAGMVPTISVTGTLTDAAPRARGDGPAQTRARIQGVGCSPRTRGWSPRQSP